MKKKIGNVTLTVIQRSIKVSTWDETVSDFYLRFGRLTEKKLVAC